MSQGIQKMSKPKSEQEVVWSLTKEYRKERSRRRRQTIGANQTNYENRKQYHKKVSELLAIQNESLPDPEDKLKKFVIARMLRAAKWRAKRDNKEFSITEKDIELPEFCPVSGIQLKLSVRGPDKRAAFSLDRIDNTKGYVRGNVRVISNEVNCIKGAKSVEFFERLVAYMKGKI
jgi:hypothetical protein